MRFKSSFFLNFSHILARVTKSRPKSRQQRTNPRLVFFSFFFSIQNNLGSGVSVLSLTGEGRDSEESSFTPLKEVSAPYHIFSLVDMCDTNKEIIVEERVILYYKYDNVPVNCVKIFRNIIKPFGFRYVSIGHYELSFSRNQNLNFFFLHFRLLQFNLYNSTSKPGRPDSISLYDGSIYNVSAPLLTTIEVGSPLAKKMIKSTGSSLSVRLFANGASNVHGFIAEIVTLPISAIGFSKFSRNYSTVVRSTPFLLINFHFFVAQIATFSTTFPILLFRTTKEAPLLIVALAK